MVVIVVVVAVVVKVVVVVVAVALALVVVVVALVVVMVKVKSVSGAFGRTFGPIDFGLAAVALWLGPLVGCVSGLGGVSRI